MTQKKFTSDIDIDVGNRDQILDIIKVTPASINRAGKWHAHNTGVYPTKIPIDAFTGRASLDYKDAEIRGYAKLDLLNVGIYTQITDDAHLNRLMTTEPMWELIYDREFCEMVVHIGNHHATLQKMPEPVNSIPRLAMFLAVIRPAKRHLIGKSWKEVAKTVWLPDETNGYQFKKSHSVSYATLVAVHINLLCEQISSGELQV